MLVEGRAVICSTNSKSNIELLQSVQDRCARLATGKIKLPSLQSKLHFTDLWEGCKILNGHYKMEENNSSSQTGGCVVTQRLMKQQSKTVARSNFFALRVIDRWDFLPSDEVNVLMLVIFKKKLRILLK